MLHETECMTVGAVGSFCLGRWRNVPDVEGFRAMHRAISDWAETAPPFVAINVVDLHALVHVPDDVRKEIARVQESFSGKQLGLATVIPERGFFAAAVRAVAGAVQMISRATFPQRVFGDIDEAIAWGASLGAKHPEPPWVRAALDALAPRPGPSMKANP